FAHQLIGDADATAAGHGIGKLLGLHGAPCLLAEAAAEILVGAEAGKHLLGQKVEEDAFQLLGLLANLQNLLRAERAGRTDRVHHSTSISACRAPVTLMACRIAMRSRGEMPRA